MNIKKYKSIVLKSALIGAVCALLHLANDALILKAAHYPWGQYLLEFFIFAAITAILNLTMGRNRWK